MIQTVFFFFIFAFVANAKNTVSYTNIDFWILLEKQMMWRAQARARVTVTTFRQNTTFQPAPDPTWSVHLLT